MLVVEFVQECTVSPFRELGFLVNQSHDVERTNSDQVQSFLVVHELNVLPVDGLIVVLFLFQFEDVLHEELLQILVRIVDAELFERVRVEVLETEDVQDSDGCP